MPAKSKAQQQMFGIAHAIQQGKMPASKARGPATDVAKAAKPKDVKDFASTKTKNLPTKVKKEQIERIREYVTKVVREVMSEGHQSPFEYEINKLSNEHPTDVPTLKKLLAQATKDSKNKSLSKRDHQMADAKRHLYGSVLKRAKQGFYNEVLKEGNFEFEWYEQGRWLTKKLAGSKHDADVMLDKIRDRVHAAGEATGNVSYKRLSEVKDDRQWEIVWHENGKAHYRIVKSEQAAKNGVNVKIRQLQSKGEKTPNVSYSKIN